MFSTLSITEMIMLATAKLFFETAFRCSFMQWFFTYFFVLIRNELRVICDRVKSMTMLIQQAPVAIFACTIMHNYALCLFSSPEHEVLMESYCDRPSSTFYLEATFSVQSSWNLVRVFVLIKSLTSLKLGHVGSKTRSLGQILEKPCVRSRGHIFSPIFMKLCQNVCLDVISNQVEIGSCGNKN